VATLREEDLLRLGVRSGHARLILLRLPNFLAAAAAVAEYAATAGALSHWDTARTASSQAAGGGRRPARRLPLRPLALPLTPPQPMSWSAGGWQPQAHSWADRKALNGAFRW
jgi:hypothetical protein